MIIDIYDIETNGLLQAKREKGQVTPPLNTVHCISLIRIEQDEKGAYKAVRKISACDQRGYEKGKKGRGWERMSIVDCLQLLAEADLRIGHNIQDFDERALARVFPWWKPKPGSKILDTLLLSRLIYPDIKKRGPNSHKIMPFQRGQHRLEVWGLRLGVLKGEYKGGWSHWNEEMQVYVEQDSEVTFALFKWLWSQKPATEAMDLEHEFAAIIRRQERRGFTFHSEKAITLLSELQERENELEGSLIASFGEWWESGKKANSKAEDIKASSYSFRQDEVEDEGEEDEEEQQKRAALFYSNREYAEVIVPTKKRRSKMIGFPEVTLPRFSEKTGKALKPYQGNPYLHFYQGAAYTPVKRVQFKPSSRQHIWKRLMYMYDWKPVKWTPGGKTPPQPKVDEDVLRGLPYPEARLLAEYYLILKRLGQLSMGPKAWLKMAEVTEDANGKQVYRIHGRVNTNGAVTGRCTHMSPNLAQVPKNTAAQKDYPDSPMLHGMRCRELFIASPGYELWGFDGAALELRMLAHYIHKWDGGEYADIVVKGDKSKGTDPHSWLRDLIGTDLLGSGDGGRDNAKTTMYAELYGAGQLKIGSIVMPTGSDKEKIQLGKEIKAKMEDRFVAKAQLGDAITEAVKDRKYLIGLDGRKLHVRKAHAALNTLLQSAGAIAMKKALVILDQNLQTKANMKPGLDYEFVGNIHDEAQAEGLPDKWPIYQQHAEQALGLAGKHFRLNCPLEAEADRGTSWADTH